MKLLVEGIDKRAIPLSFQGAHNAGEGSVRIRTAVILRTLRNFSGDDRGTKLSFGEIVRGWDGWVIEKPQKVSAIMVPAKLV